jgi:hypothetical protein
MSIDAFTHVTLLGARVMTEVTSADGCFGSTMMFRSLDEAERVVAALLVKIRGLREAPPAKPAEGGAG